MNKDITFCPNIKCEHVDCMRYYKNAPFNVLTSWFKSNPEDKNGECRKYLNR